MGTDPHRLSRRDFLDAVGHRRQLGARYVGRPAGSLDMGLIRGFMTEAQASSVVLLEDLQGDVNRETLRGLLPDGPDGETCDYRGSSQDDRDGDGTVDGWYFYLNYGASTVDWTDA